MIDKACAKHEEHGWVEVRGEDDIVGTDLFPQPAVGIWMKEKT